MKNNIVLSLSFFLALSSPFSGLNASEPKRAIVVLPSTTQSTGKKINAPSLKPKSTIIGSYYSCEITESSAHKELCAVLELPPTATNEEISKAFKKKALLYHPDKNPNNPQATEKFRKLSEAKEMDQKKSLYCVQRTFKNNTIQLPEVTDISDIFNNQHEKDLWATYPKSMSNFKKVYLIKAGIVAALMAGRYAVKKYSSDELKKRYEKFKKEHPKWFSCMKYSAKGMLSLGLGILPLYALRNNLNFANATNHYKVDKDTIHPVTLFREDYTVTTQSGNVKTTTHYYGPPHCYMIDDQKDEAFTPLRKAKVARAWIALASTLGFFGPMFL